MIKQLTSRSRILLEKLLVSQLVKKLTTFSTTRGFITAFTKALLSQTDYGRSILTLSSHLGERLTSALFSTVSPNRVLYLIPLPRSVLHAAPSQNIFLFTRQIYRYKLFLSID